MDSDESGHSESEFYYPEEETLNQIAPKNFFPKFKEKKRKKKQINMLFTGLGRSVWEKIVPLVLSTYSRPRAQFFSHTDLPLGK